MSLRSEKDIPGLKVTVMGLGLNGGGLASARFFAQSGAIVTVTDLRDEAVLKPSIEALHGLPIRFVLGRHEDSDFSKADIVIKNPAVSPDSHFLRLAKFLETDISVFLRLSPSPIIAITGSKGKSTSSSAIHHCLLKAGKSSFLGGNITVSPLSFLKETTSDSPVVLELSSWQLADMKGMGVLKPRIALLTSIMPDHLNKYESMEAYVADKRLIYADQDGDCATVCNFDEEYGRSFASESKAKVFFYSEKPLKSDVYGSWLEGKKGFMRSDRGDCDWILPESLLSPGPHQRKNMLAVSTVARLYGIDCPCIRDAVAGFPGIEHRLECFAESKGVRYFNDTAATIPQAAAAAVKSFESPLILITGGTDKALDFCPLAEVADRPKALVLLDGSGTEKLIPLLAEQGRTWEGPYSSLKEAVEKAFQLAKPGDTVLLSPGCASFGMFLNEFDRGRQFKALVKGLLSD